MNKNVIIAIVVVIVLLIGGWLLMQNIGQNSSVTQDNQTSSQTEQQNTNSQPTTTTQVQHEVTYTDAGYSPSQLTIKAGDTVTFKNQSSHGMWTASGVHPSHTVYSGTTVQEHCPDTANTSFDECTAAQPGESWSFTFQKTGTWSYHNHVRASDFGNIIVQ